MRVFGPIGFADENILAYQCSCLSSAGHSTSATLLGIQAEIAPRLTAAEATLELAPYWPGGGLETVVPTHPRLFTTKNTKDTKGVPL
jgi:hypothetical protein